MNAVQILELVSAALIIFSGVYLMRRRLTDGSRTGSQGGVILIIIGAMIAIHGFGLLEYRPSPAELERMSQ